MEQSNDDKVANVSSSSVSSSSPSPDQVRVAPKLFIKALPGGAFQSSPCSSLSSPSSSIRPGPPPPPPLVSKPSSHPVHNSPTGRPTMSSTSTPNRGTEKGSPDSRQVYLPNTRFLNAGTRNFLKPRKTLPGLTPISALKQSTSTSPSTSTSTPMGIQPTQRSAGEGTSFPRNIIKPVQNPVSSTMQGPPGSSKNFRMQSPNTNINNLIDPMRFSNSGLTITKVNTNVPTMKGVRPLFKARPGLPPHPQDRVGHQPGKVNNKGGMLINTPPHPIIPGSSTSGRPRLPQEKQKVAPTILLKPTGGIVRPIRIPTSRIISNAALQRQIKRGFESAAMSVSGLTDKTAPPGPSPAPATLIRQLPIAFSTSKIEKDIQDRLQALNEPLHKSLMHHIAPAPRPQPTQDRNLFQSSPDTTANALMAEVETPANDHRSGKRKREELQEVAVSSSESPSVPPEGEEKEASQDSDVNARRTGRQRKPTKHFMTDFIPPTRRRKEVSAVVEGGADQGQPWVGGLDSTMPIGDRPPNDQARTRGRPRGTGRGRGRPRGSTLKARVERDNNSTLSSPIAEMMDSTNVTDSEPSINDGVEHVVENKELINSQHTSEMESPESISPRPLSGRGSRGGRGRGSRGASFSVGPSSMSRGARRGGRGRGSRGARGAARNLLLAKRRAELQMAALLASPDPEPRQKEPNLQVFEEETRMSADESLTADDETKPTFTETAVVNDEPPTPVSTTVSNVNEDEVSNLSSTSLSAGNTSIAKTKKFSKDLIDERKPVTAETLYEYRWPLNSSDAEYYFLQEQIIEFLGHKSFRRKYPNLRRRCVEMEERDFLREQKIVSETQCDLGLTAVNSTEVLDILYADFPTKYEEYRKVEVEKREKELTHSQVNSAAVAAGNGNCSTRDKSAEFLSRITKACAKWNAAFNRDRKETRSYCFDLQTGTMNVPAGKMKVCTAEQTKLGYHPVTVLPGQYSDGFKMYTPVELKYLPLNTVMYGPVQENKALDDSDSDVSSTTDNSSSSSSSDDEGSDVAEGTTDKLVSKTLVAVDEKDSQGVCKTCNGDYHKNKIGRTEMLIHCAKCDSANHPTCLELSVDMVPYIKKYDWQCTDCKNCIECNDPADEDKMLFCDCCDRGYHIYCVGLRKVPTGRWHCVTCSVCHSCGVNDPSPDDRAADWHHEYKKGERGMKFFLHSLCVSCHKIYKKGQFCPSCLKCHLKLDDKTLVECRSCEKWVHKHCIQKPLQAKFGFLCESCESSNFTTRTKLPQSKRN